MKSGTEALERWLASQHLYPCDHMQCVHGITRRTVAPGIAWSDVLEPEDPDSLARPSPLTEEEVITKGDIYTEKGKKYTDEQEQRLLRDYRETRTQAKYRKKREKAHTEYNRIRPDSPAMREYNREVADYESDISAMIRRNREYNALHRRARIRSRNNLSLSVEFSPLQRRGIEAYLRDHSDELCHCFRPRSHCPVLSMPAMVGPRRDIVSPLGGWPILRTQGYRFPGVPPYRQSLFKGARPTHAGWDFESAMGEPVYAIADGWITCVSTINTPSNYGYFVSQEVTLHDTEGRVRKYFPFYAHLSAIHVQIGECVSAGTRLGLTGDTGLAVGMTEIGNGAHLHFGLHIDGVFDLTDRYTLSRKTLNTYNGVENWVDDPEQIFGDPAQYYFG